MTDNVKKAGTTRRRTFLKSTGAAVIGGTLAYNMGIVGAMAAGSSNTLKVGLIGCG